MTELDPGRLIGSYRVVRRIGQGGMGTVYEVEHLDLGVRYALKTFSFDPSEEHAEVLKAKFLEEGKLLARLKHPNLTHVFDLAYDAASESLYFVMDLVTYGDGESYTAEDVDLADVDEELVFKWFRELASALDYIHAEGIVHRDVKPANLLVDKDLNVVLTDFGISHIFGERAKVAVEARTTMVTKTGRGKLVLGTEKYMAPEVAAGEDATPAADAYALGVMTLRWLTGFFYGDNPGALALLSKKKYRWLAVLPRLLAPAERRPEKYADLVRQLKPLAGADAKKSAKPRVAQERKTLLRAGLMAVLAAAFLGGFCYFGWMGWQKYQADREADARRFAEMQKRLAEQKDAQPTAVTNTIVKVIEKTPASAERNPPVAEPVPSKPQPKQKAESPKPREQMNIVTNEPEKVGYGPIPDVTYKWFADKAKKDPLKVPFKLANGATIDLVPLKANDFLMLNHPKSGKVYHKVTLTRPFWMSQLCLTAEQWREFRPECCENCRELESAAPKGTPVYTCFTPDEWKKCCKFLTEKYHRQLPKGYVFRLATDAEWMYARKVAGIFTSPERKQLIGVLKEKLRGSRYEMGDNGWLQGRMVGLGSVAKNDGIYDLDSWYQCLLDRLPREATAVNLHVMLCYDDEETDPLRWTDAVDCKHLVRCGENHVGVQVSAAQFIAHLVLGADLLAEDRKVRLSPNEKKDVKIPARRYAWKTPSKLSHPLETRFKLANGEEMIFCYCPKGKFEMRNPAGQNGDSHRVELTRPYWITKYCVTAKQWRDYGKYDCEGVVREVERLVPDLPVYKLVDRTRLDAYCEFLTQRYGASLPKGYVFRLPTEAEWEHALRCGNRAVSANCWNGAQANLSIVEDLLRKRMGLSALARKYGARIGLGGAFDLGIALGRMMIGGRGQNEWGVCDLSFGEYGGCAVLDFVEVELDPTLRKEPGWLAKRLVYEDVEVDPVRWDGEYANAWLTRASSSLRTLDYGRSGSLAHIVIGPDVLAPLKAAEKAPYPEIDFGGALISPKCKFGGVSSCVEGWSGQLKLASLLSRDPISEDEDPRTFHTKIEGRPWVQIDLPGKMEIVGLLIESRGDQNGIAWERAAPLAVWTSDKGTDKGPWTPVRLPESIGKQALHRYRIDLSKRPVKCKYIRVGREPDAKEEFFHLQKIMIYALPEK